MLYSRSSSKKLGMAAIVDKNEKLVGVLTDGDIRRALIQSSELNSKNVFQVMNHYPKTIKPETLAQDALTIMQMNKITSLILIDTENHPIGVLHIHDLLKIGFKQKEQLN